MHSCYVTLPHKTVFFKCIFKISTHENIRSLQAPPRRNGTGTSQRRAQQTACDKLGMGARPAVLNPHALPLSPAPFIHLLIRLFQKGLSSCLCAWLALSPPGALRPHREKVTGKRTISMFSDSCHVPSRNLCQGSSPGPGVQASNILQACLRVWIQVKAGGRGQGGHKMWEGSGQSRQARTATGKSHEGKAVQSPPRQRSRVPRARVQVTPPSECPR